MKRILVCSLVVLIAGTFTLAYATGDDSKHQEGSEVCKAAHESGKCKMDAAHEGGRTCMKHGGHMFMKSLTAEQRKVLDELRTKLTKLGASREVRRTAMRAVLQAYGVKSVKHEKSKKNSKIVTARDGGAEVAKDCCGHEGGKCEGHDGGKCKGHEGAECKGHEGTEKEK